MKIKELSLANFRRFERFTLNFNPGLTALVARNGQGKTSVLDAIAITLGTFVGAFDMGSGRRIQVSDARYGITQFGPEREQQFPVSIRACYGPIDGHSVEITRELLRPKSQTTIKDAAPLTSYGNSLMDAVRKQSEVVLPLVSYYGSGRLWMAHKSMARKTVISASRTMGYEDCLTSASSFKQLQGWMSKATLAVMQQEGDELHSYRLKQQLEGIKQAVGLVLAVEGWGDFHYSLSLEELAMRHEELGLLPVGLLSDGVRAMVSLAADMAWRCAKLNPQFGEHAASQTPGIVLIDEVDLHLHPSWQQKVLGSLRAAFPQLQFIVTTHSPQVLTTIDKSCIRILGDADSLVAEEPGFQTLGVSSHDALVHIMAIDPVPEVDMAKKLAQYQHLIEQGEAQQEAALQLRETLINHFGADHSSMIECDHLIRMQRMRRDVMQKRQPGDA